MPIVNKHLPTPYYAQLASILRDTIRQRPDDERDFLLPSETELASVHKITRATVRQAFDVLEREGLIYREKGKGTFATKPRSRYELTTLIPTTDDIVRRGWKPGVQVISAQEIAAAAQISEALNLPAETTVYEICRLRLGNDEPLCLQWSYLPAQRFPNLLGHDLTQSLTRVLETEYSLYFWSAHEVLRARLCTEPEAKLLQVSPKSAVIHMERITQSTDRSPTEFLRTVWRSDRYDFEFDLNKPHR